jgi:hypothetical protein
MYVLPSSHPFYRQRDVEALYRSASSRQRAALTIAVPRYFVPASCQSCSHPANAHCDRGYPTCGRCRQKGTACIAGTTWRFIRLTKTKRQTKEEDTEELLDVAENPNFSHKRRHSFEGRNKKRTVDEYYDTHDPYDKSLKIGKKPRAFEPLTQPYPFPPHPSSVNSTPVASKVPAPGNAGGAALNGRSFKRPLRKAPAVPTADPPISADDRAYYARVEANNRKEGLRGMKGECPVWADTRKELCAAVEYLRDPRKTAGASVEVGKGGIARGVILEGQAPAQEGFWGRGERAGTIVCSM